MEWFKQHADTLVILSSFALCFWHMNEKFTEKNEKFTEKLNNIEKEIAIIKTILVMKNIMPNELAIQEGK